MALVDKHKVKRQRLDRICEGKSQRGWRFLNRERADRPWAPGPGLLARLLPHPHPQSPAPVCGGVGGHLACP